MRKTRVLFLCTGNSARSQMAEALLRKHGGEQYAAFSAGIEPKQIHPMTRQVLAEAGMDMAGQYAKPLTDYMGQAQFDYLITVCDAAEERCPFFPGMGVRRHWSIEDPAAATGTPEEVRDVFRRTRDEIEERVLGLVRELGEPNE